MSEKKERLWVQVFIAIAFLAGIGAFLSLIRVPSESKNAVWLGFSAGRLALAFGTLAGILLIFVFFLISCIPNCVKIRANLSSLFREPFPTFSLFSLCWVISWGIFFIFLMSFLPVRLLDSKVSSLVSRAWGMLVWVFLMNVEIEILLILHNGRKFFQQQIRVVFLFTLWTAAFYFFASYYDQIDWNIQIHHLKWILGLPVFFAWAGSLLNKYSPSQKKRTKFELFCLCCLIGTLSYAIYHLTGCFMGRWNTPSKAYWNLLAQSFLEGKLYLENPPSFHDLTLYGGKWFVPNPPLPAILLMPVVWLLKDPEAVNMTVFSAVIAAVNVVLVFLVLKRVSDRKMISISLNGILWITAVFAVGTNHYWLATIGQMWFVSQLLTVTFVTASILSAVDGKSGWLSGALLGLAVLARPNIFPMYLLLAGIYLGQNGNFPKCDGKKFISWGLKSGIPVCISVFLILGYNKIRFSDWTDFGYVTINGADWILENVRKYGMFNIHFFKTNARVMFLQLPGLDFSGKEFFFQPGIAGFSIFVMTPPLIYIFRRFQKSWWQMGAWSSVLLTTLLLLCYSNTGAEQVGYRYLMDEIVSLLLLMGCGMGERPSWLFKLLTCAGGAVNFLSIYWWYIGRI